MSRFLLSPDLLLTISGAPRKKTSVYIENGKIKDIGSTTQLSKKYRDCKIVNLKNSCLLPGFINAHVHLELGWITKYIGGFNSFAGWLRQIINAKKNNISRKTITDSINSGIDELIKSGTTTVGEISSYDGIDKSILKKSGLRAVVYNEVFDRHLEVLGEWNFNNNHMFEERVFPHATYSCSPETLIGINKYCHKNNIKAAIHLAECREETSFVNNRTNIFERNIYPLIDKHRFRKIRAVTPVQYLSNYKFFNGIKSTAVHMVQVVEDDIEDVIKYDIGIILCPRSNNFLNVGLPPVNLYKELKRVGIGTDGLSSNFNLDMFEELRFFYLSFRDILGAEASRITLQLATLGGARSLFIDENVGSIEVGKYADLIAVNPSKKYTDPYLNIIASGSDNLVMSMVNGKVIYSRDNDFE